MHGNSIIVSHALNEHDKIHIDDLNELSAEEIAFEDLSTAVTQKRYADVRYILSGHDSLDPNTELIFLGSIYMTSLEFSVFQGDWRMALILFMNGADPIFNCFDGTIKIKDSSKTQLVDDSFQDEECIPGFAGLRVLIQDRNSSSEMAVCLSLMEVLYGTVNLDAKKDTQLIMECFAILFQALSETQQERRQLLHEVSEYVQKCCGDIIDRVQKLDPEVLNSELFDLIMFSLRKIVQEVIGLCNCGVMMRPIRH